jgi:hypothetical protein
MFSTKMKKSDPKVIPVTGPVITKWGNPYIWLGALNTGSVSLIIARAAEGKRNQAKHICVQGGNNLPTPFGLTGDPL